MELKTIEIILKLVLLIPTIYIGYIIKEYFIIKEYKEEYDEILELIPKVIVISTIIIYIILKERVLIRNIVSIYRNIKIDKIINKIGDINYRIIKRYNKEMESTLYEKINILEIYRNISKVYIIVRSRIDFAINNYSLYYIIYSISILLISYMILLVILII